MKSNLNKINIKNLASSLLHFLISFMVLTGSLHLYEHSHAKEDGYTICTPACDTDTHHSINDHCETCLKNRYQHKIFYHADFYNLVVVMLYVIILLLFCRYHVVIMLLLSCFCYHVVVIMLLLSYCCFHIDFIMLL